MPYVPPSGGSLEIGNNQAVELATPPNGFVPPSGGSLEIGNRTSARYPLRGTPVPPSGGSLEIGNHRIPGRELPIGNRVPPSGGSLEIGNWASTSRIKLQIRVPPSGGSLEIGNYQSICLTLSYAYASRSPFGGIPRNWKRRGQWPGPLAWSSGSPFGGIPRNWKPQELERGISPLIQTVPPSGGSLEIGNPVS